MPPPTTNLLLHLDAGTFGGVDADPIGTLADQSGNSNDGTATGSDRPTYKTSIVNGLPVARFTAVPQKLTTPASASLSPKPRNYTDKAWQASVTDEQLEKTIKFGGAGVGKSPAMPSNPDLDPATIVALRDIVRSFGK